MSQGSSVPTSTLLSPTVRFAWFSLSRCESASRERRRNLSAQSTRRRPRRRSGRAPARPWTRARSTRPQ
eukprot:3770883-Pyramimonas_sp.AAC.1